MKPSLYLHIGYPKTGTSSLQNFCAQNEDVLRAHGMLYPKTGRIGTAHYGFSLRLGLGTYQKPEEIKPLAALLADLGEEIAQAGAQRALLSSESFILSDEPDVIRDAFSAYDVTIVVYLRRHDRAFESAYAQSMKLGQAPPWNATIESYILHQMAAGQVPYDYLAALRTWSEAFGVSKMIVRPFEKTSGETTLYTDFLNAIGMTVAADALTWPERRNSSASYATLVAMSTVQRSPAPQTIKKALLRKLLQSDAPSGRRGEVQLLSPQNRVAIVERYQSMYAAIAREFMGRRDGRLFAEASPRRDQEWLAPREPTQQELANSIISAAALLMTPAAVRFMRQDIKPASEAAEERVLTDE